MVLPTRWEGEAIGENVRSNAHEGQSQRYQFMKRATAISPTPFRNWTCENVLGGYRRGTVSPEFSQRFLAPPGGMPHPMWQELYNAALVEVDLLNFLNVSKQHVSNSSTLNTERTYSHCGGTQGAWTMLCECWSG